MIRGIGVDLCGISRMEKTLQQARFMERVFTDEERVYIKSRGAMQASSAAACFAAKEAFAKALGTGIGPIAFSEVEILHEEGGKPYYRLHGKAQVLAKEKGIAHCHLSISHEGEMALAFCVLEGMG